jgi:septation ring formation regulator EzrA
MFQKGRRDSDLSSIQSWASTHQKEADARDMQISELSRIAAASEATAKAMKESLQEMREELRDIRNRDMGWRQSVAGTSGDHPAKRNRL